MLGLQDCTGHVRATGRHRSCEGYRTAPVMWGLQDGSGHVRATGRLRSCEGYRTAPVMLGLQDGTGHVRATGRLRSCEGYRTAKIRYTHFGNTQTNTHLGNMSTNIHSVKKVNKYTFGKHVNKYAIGKHKPIHILQVRTQINSLWNMYIALQTSADSSSGPIMEATKYYTTIRTTTVSLLLAIYAETLNQFRPFPAHYVPCYTEPY